MTSRRTDAPGSSDDRQAPPFVSILMPAYNEEENLAWVLPLLLGHLDLLARPFEIVVIDDGSRDRTAQVVEEFGSRRPEVRLVRHGRNMGPGSGIPTGLRAARGEYAVFVPADLAIEPEDLMRMIQAGPGWDVVVGIRSDRRDYTLARKAVSHVNVFLIRLLFGLRFRQFNYLHLYRRAIFERIWPETRGVFLTAEVLVRARDAGMSIREFEARYVPRTRGQATCGNSRVIFRTVRDLFRFWARWALGW